MVFAEDVAASGGYFIACAGDEITQPSSIIGSIGVISASFGFKDLIKKLEKDEFILLEETKVPFILLKMKKKMTLKD